jgi:hypothetical protein
MKNLSPYPAWHETPRTNALIQEVQSTPIPFDTAFWRLLELTRTLEVENGKYKQARKAKKKKVVTRASRGELKAKPTRRLS